MKSAALPLLAQLAAGLTELHSKKTMIGHDAAPAAAVQDKSWAEADAMGVPLLSPKSWGHAHPALLVSLLDAVADAGRTTLRDFTDDWLSTLFGRVFCACLMGTFFAFCVWSLSDFMSFLRLRSQNRQEATKEMDGKAVPATGTAAAAASLAKSSGQLNKEEAKWTVTGILALTSYRFYTGFLSATWLPYLLAMEGQDLWRDNQSLFMGVAKLIYGLTILLNPIFGLLGDQATKLSHGIGRRLFVCSGCCTAALGIFFCITAARSNSFWLFIIGIMIWRLGEGLNDVTTEALVPEMVPASQYKFGSAIKASSFLVGGLFGYVLLMLFVHVHYSWLYYSYLFGMFACALPSLMLLHNDAPAPGRPVVAGQDFLTSVTNAYIQPAQYRGGFPTACWAVFVFSLGSAPIFFLLLILRDLLRIANPVRLQWHFSMVSIVFFIAAAVASAVGALFDEKTPEPGTPEDDKKIDEIRRRKIFYLVTSMCIFGAIVVTIPAMALLERSQALIAFYCLAVLFGGSFGSSFSRFQDCTWAELPPNVDMANAMGFNLMSRLLGVGVGNFVAGVILDFFHTGIDVPSSSEMYHAANTANSLIETDLPTEFFQVYSSTGYLVLCELCAALIFAAAYITYQGLNTHNKAELAAINAAEARAAAASSGAGSQRGLAGAS